MSSMSHIASRTRWKEDQPGSISCLNCFCDGLRGGKWLQVSGCPPPHFLPSGLLNPAPEKNDILTDTEPPFLSLSSSVSIFLVGKSIVKRASSPLHVASSALGRVKTSGINAAAPLRRQAPVNISNMTLWKTLFPLLSGEREREMEVRESGPRMPVRAKC